MAQEYLSQLMHKRRGHVDSGAREQTHVCLFERGGGLYGPALFDTYRAFTPRPAAMFALPIRSSIGGDGL